MAKKKPHPEARDGYATEEHISVLDTKITHLELQIEEATADRQAHHAEIDDLERRIKELEEQVVTFMSRP